MRRAIRITAVVVLMVLGFAAVALPQQQQATPASVTAQLVDNLQRVSASSLGVRDAVVALETAYGEQQRRIRALLDAYDAEGQEGLPDAVEALRELLGEDAPQ